MGIARASDSGKNGSIFAYGDATFYGSLPGLGVAVNNVVGADAHPLAAPRPDRSGRQ